MILVPNRFASIGSQNLTRGGTLRKEATVILTDSAVVGKIHKLAKRWIGQAVPITMDRIREMNILVPSLNRAFRRFCKDAVAADKQVAVKVAQNAELQIRDLQRRLAKLPSARAAVVVRVTKVEHANWGFGLLDLGTQTRSLLASAREDLTRWLIDGELIRLQRMKRYICLNEDTGTIGWARVGKTRITFVANGVSGLTIQLAKWHCKVAFNSVTRIRPSLDANLKITLTPKGITKSLNIDAWFGLSKIHIVAISGQRASRVARELSDWIGQHRSAFNRRILELLLEPFQYEKNLFGVQADAFFGGVGSRCRLRLYEISGKPLLGAKKIC
jgi:hypothetical protein